VVEQAIHRFLWAKLGKNDLYHPLICRLIDVALVAQGLWDEVPTYGIRDHHCTLPALSREESRAILSFCIRLDDLGKANAAFHAGLIFLTLP